MAKWSQEGHDWHVLTLAEEATSRDAVGNHDERSKELSAIEGCK